MLSSNKNRIEVSCFFKEYNRMQKAHLKCETAVLLSTKHPNDIVENKPSKM